jgi:hypothetical protein
MSVTTSARSCACDRCDPAGPGPSAAWSSRLPRATGRAKPQRPVIRCSMPPPTRDGRRHAVIMILSAVPHDAVAPCRRHSPVNRRGVHANRVNRGGLAVAVVPVAVGGRRVVHALQPGRPRRHPGAGDGRWHRAASVSDRYGCEPLVHIGGAGRRDRCACGGADDGLDAGRGPRVPGRENRSDCRRAHARRPSPQPCPPAT